ncbi:hypothetical protein SAMN05216327_11883 [Dyadobacter sp. SG02]|uniref:hypothetical protein n=1 Tax=Dyadobacter sp. SG02 TaxID=1855291 RepID=UPI0008C73B3C|nr:hypothetical protein [Dyadobacter sp. SG02]SEJ75098.1 hypothetical protein SAMN05216327_11883 [Dyadobacter sp. SG02]
MDWALASIGLLVIGLGVSIWRFRLVRWLSNIPRGREIIDKEKAARLGGSYLCLIGLCFIAFGYAVDNLSDQAVMVIVACFIPVNMVALVSYLVAQSKNIR